MDTKKAIHTPSTSEGSRPSRPRTESSPGPLPPAGGYIRVNESKEAGAARRLSAMQPVQLPSGAFTPLPGQEMLRDALRLVKPLESTPAELREGLKKLITHQVLQGCAPDRIAVALTQCIEAVFGVPARDDKRSAGDEGAAGRVLRAAFEAFGQREGVNLADLLGPALATSGQPAVVLASWLLAQSRDGVVRGDLWATALETLASIGSKSADWQQDGLDGIARAQQCCWDEAAATLRAALIDRDLDTHLDLHLGARTDPRTRAVACDKVLANWGTLVQVFCEQVPAHAPGQIQSFVAATIHGEQQANQRFGAAAVDASALKSRLVAALGAAFQAGATTARLGAVVAGLCNGVAQAWPDARAQYLAALKEGIDAALATATAGKDGTAPALVADEHTLSDCRRFLLGRLVDGQARGEPVSRPTPPAAEEPIAAAHTVPGGLVLQPGRPRPDAAPPEAVRIDPTESEAPLQMID